MTVRQPKTVIEILTTGDELRRVAATLEALFSRAKTGDDLPKMVYFCPDGTEVHFVPDQESMQHLRDKK